MNNIYSIFTSMNPPKRFTTLLLAFFTMYFIPLNQIYAQQNVPCDCAQRWTDGGAWNPDGSIDDSPPNNAPAKGIIKCASQAGTQPSPT